jgi:hypothetical protein
LAQHAGFAISDEHVALDANDGADVPAPVGPVKFIGWIEDSDGAAFVTVATRIAAMGNPARGSCGGDFLDLSVQGRLVVLNLDDQGDVGFCGDLEVFF